LYGAFGQRSVSTINEAVNQCHVVMEVAPRYWRLDAESDLGQHFIALIGVILLIGIVKKNAILIIDFALQAEREFKMESREAICHAAVIRFRPIIMTTTAAMLSALPLCFNFGEGSELRQPLGISIVGGLRVVDALHDAGGLSRSLGPQVQLPAAPPPARRT
jgi:hypothetical protein